MTTSALLRHGPDHATTLVDGLAAWMRGKGFGSPAEFRGILAPAADATQAAYGRPGYLSAVERATQTYAPR